MNPTLVVELSGDKMLEPHRLGGKAHSLNHLIQAGLPVPPAFCITAQAYRQFIEFAVPGALLDTGAPGNVRDMILSAAIPAPLDLAIRHACKQLGDGLARRALFGAGRRRPDPLFRRAIRHLPARARG